MVQRKDQRGHPADPFIRHPVFPGQGKQQNGIKARRTAELPQQKAVHFGRKFPVDSPQAVALLIIPDIKNLRCIISPEILIVNVPRLL